MLDPISDMLTRIRNAGLAGHAEVFVPLSKMKRKIADIMDEKNFIDEVGKTDAKGREYIRIKLKYIRDEKGRKIPYIQGLKRVSREGQRVYTNKKRLPVVKNGFGFAIISTSKGLMTNDEARKEGAGGEVICEIW